MNESRGRRFTGGVSLPVKKPLLIILTNFYLYLQATKYKHEAIVNWKRREGRI